MIRRLPDNPTRNSANEATAAQYTVQDAERNPLDAGHPSRVDLQGELLPELYAGQKEQCDQGMSWEVAEAAARRVMLHLYRGSIELARNALEGSWKSHMAEHVPLPKGRRLRREPLSRVIDDPRILDGLDYRDIRTIGEFLDADEELLKIKTSVGRSGPKFRYLILLRAELRERVGSQDDEDDDDEPLVVRRSEAQIQRDRTIDSQVDLIEPTVRRLWKCGVYPSNYHVMRELDLPGNKLPLRLEKIRKRVMEELNIGTKELNLSKRAGQRRIGHLSERY